MPEGGTWPGSTQEDSQKLFVRARTVMGGWGREVQGRCLAIGVKALLPLPAGVSQERGSLQHPRADLRLLDALGKGLEAAHRPAPHGDDGAACCIIFLPGCSGP